MAEPDKPKNLVILHLESVSNTILWQYRVELATVWRLMQESRCFSRFQAAATSTAMAMAYAGWGDGGFFDFKTTFSQNPTQEQMYHYSRQMLPMWSLLQDGFGYKYAEYILNPLLRNNQPNPWGCQFPEMSGMLAETNRFLDEMKASGQPFALYFSNAVSHMAFDDGVKYSAQTFSDRFRAGYRSFDQSINQLLGFLAEKGLWENTLIVGYGDHGDELWSHGLNKGYCHAFAPYASLTWTPLFIYDNGRDAGVTDRLMSAIDFKETVFRTLLPDADIPDIDFSWGKFPRLGQSDFPGMNVMERQRDFAFAQNLYAMQLEYADPEKGLAKGYAVTDGVYRLVAVSGGRRPKEGGMEFYCDRVDPTNSRNLLDFFRLDHNGDIAAFTPPPEAVSPEFALMFNPEAVQHMTETFRTLRRELHAYVRAKEEKALPFNSGGRHLMPEESFRFARKRIRKDYDE